MEIIQLSNPFGMAEFLAHLNRISFSVLLILLFMSVLTWYLIVTKLVQLWLTRRRSHRFLHLFWNAPSLEEVLPQLTQESVKDPFSNLAFQGIRAATHHEKVAPFRLGIVCTHSEFITRTMRRAIVQDTARLESGLTVLATIGSTAPFIGLFGTVIGIYDALINISTRGNAALDTVAAPVGEALIMTAFGLAVAIPAVLGYNILVRGNRSLFTELDTFAHDLYAYLSTGAHINLASVTDITESQTLPSQMDSSD